MTTPAPILTRTRSRPQPVPLGENSKSEIVERVRTFFKEDDRSREIEKSLRQQRYAKMMQVDVPVEEPFAGSSNVQLPDILTAVLRTEDTLQNSAMATRPMVNARALVKENADRERKVDQLLDHQFFIEQDGEDLVQQSAMNFARDGEFTALTRWVKEVRKILLVREFGPIPMGIPPMGYFQQLLERAFTPGRWRPMAGSDGWDWEVSQGDQEYLVRFYTEEEGDGTIMQIESDAETYRGPCSMVYDWEDVLAPAWALNLQPPGPSNPGGAPHVILVDYPTRDEILRGIEFGFYDLASESDLEGIEGWRDWSDSDRELDRQRRELRGQQSSTSEDADEDHDQMKRLICFDTWGGLDVVWTVLLAGPGFLLRARPLTEECPQIPPRRPIAHAVMIPVQGTWRGMGLPELMESMHDFQATIFNAMVDAGMFELFPWFLYRSASNLKPEDIRIGPGAGIPVQDPKNDLVPQRMNAQSTAVGSNLIALGENLQEKLVSIGDLQLGRIPAGKSSALRTSSGIQQVLAQGEARPERILRRYFKGLLQIFRTMYALDRHYLPERKKIRVVGISKPGEDPFVEIERADDLQDYHFDFHANVLNSSKLALQSALVEILNLAANPLMIQLGLSTPDSVYRVISDYTASLGQMSEKYWNEPQPQSSEAPVSAEEALQLILQGQIPQGPPAEGDFDAHAQKIRELLQEPDEMGQTPAQTLTVQEQQRLSIYLSMLAQKALQAQRQAQVLQAAQRFQADRQQNAAPGGSNGSAEGGKPTLVNRNETLNESLPVGTGTPQ